MEARHNILGTILLVLAVYGIVAAAVLLAGRVRAATMDPANASELSNASIAGSHQDPVQHTASAAERCWNQ